MEHHSRGSDMQMRDYWELGVPFAEFVQAAAPEHRGLWDGLYRTARAPAWAAKPLAAPRNLLAIAEDWCADTSSALPVLARWAEAAPGLVLRVIRRDAHPELMNRYLTLGTRSIPVIIVLDADLQELGHWGPYPAPLEEWVRGHKPPAMPKEEFVKGKRSWYAKDRGETMLRELGPLVGV
ncbi:MAG: thioredoxin family protein [Gemmatimonadetes bacterium]|nr:thioredoxin family protein [Gemmatimonadota bacterium]MBK7351313.1 thioredoxin family protein [Gemmatimonadota bacterium]MBK7715287.1 thioredoxin family protein [Gemmatimonadota bacterium]